jgi:hypothetical protein
MPRQTRQQFILAKIEATYATDSTPIGADDAILVSEPELVPLQANNVPRDFVRGYLGGSEHLVGTATKALSFTAEWAGSGTATTPPRIGRLLQACGFVQNIGASAVDYQPITTFGASTSLTIYYHLAGERHKLLGARGTFTLEAGVGERPVFRFRFVGLDGGIAAIGDPTPTYIQRAPLVITDANTGDLTLGAVTYTSGTGVLASGTAFVSRGVRLDLGNNVVHQPLLGAETVEITQRECTGNFSLDLSAAQAVTAMGDVAANTTTALGLTHGSVTGDIVGLYAPKVQRIDPRIEDVNGSAFYAFTARLVPSVGNDELRLFFR